MSSPELSKVSFELLKGLWVTPSARCVSSYSIPFELLSKALPCGSNHPPKSGDWNIKFKATAINFLNALDRIPKLIEQYKTKNEKLEKDLPTLREIVGGTWKKEDELKQLKSEVAALERKIQFTLRPAQTGELGISNDESKIESSNIVGTQKKDDNPTRNHITTTQSTVKVKEIYGFKL